VNSPPADKVLSQGKLESAGNQPEIVLLIAVVKNIWTFRSARTWAILLGLGGRAALGAAPTPPDHAGIEFFEQKIRPIFVEHCYKCHSAQAEKLKGGLHLDTHEGLLKGGDTGPAIVPGDAEKSLLIKAVRYKDEDLQMPPKGKKLASEQIADLEAWVKMGAPDPRVSGAQVAQTKVQGSGHWAFKPVTQPAIPAVKNKKWAQTPVDAFILARLEAKKLSPSPRADKRTLIRRATFDLIGLPPTPAEVQAFEADKSPEAFAKVADRLLDSPHYGERWGRYWLDVARYADTKGYVFEEERRYPYSYTYRDWVIRALNEDLPYDQFIIDQLAADVLPLGDDKRPLAALGFLTLGRRFLNNQPDIIDDRIDVVTRGMMGLTVTCARCHDHKFDPIPTRDYYSLYGVFASCSEPAEKPLLGNATLPKEYSAYEAEKKKRVEELAKYRAQKESETRTKLREHAGDYLLAAHDAAALSDHGKREALARERKLDPGVTERWRKSLEEWSKNPSPVFAPWFAFAALPVTNFAAAAKEAATNAIGVAESTNDVAAAVAKFFPAQSPPDSLSQVAGRYNQMFATVDKEWRELSAPTNSAASNPAPATAVTALPEAGKEAIRQVLYGPDSPLNLSAGELHHLYDTPAQQHLRALQRKIDEVDVTHPGAPPRAMALVDDPTPHTPHVFKRGNPGNVGEEVPRQFLQVVAGPNRKPFQKGSGRLELAQAIASKENPLTARVFVNRVWMYHFGAPLLRTPSDFGLRSEPPTHPELLDYLAWSFMEEGWSIKKLHRLILLSSAYQQSSDDNPKAAQVDPGNQWLWHVNRRRLDFEALRDMLLAISGKLDFTPGGRADDLTTQPFSARRTVYGFIERQNLPGLFRTFDFASPDTTSAQRFSTTVPQQALFLMNSPFVVEQAKHLLERPEIKSLAADDQRIQKLYQIAFQRSPDTDEIKLGQGFVRAQQAALASAPAPPAWQYGWGEFDEAAKRVKQFTALPHFTKYAWQGGTNLPDPQLGWVLLSAEGGHPGNDLQHAAIRRWQAPRDGVVSVTGELHHPSDKGDGVRGRIVSSRQGELGQWTAQHGATETNLKRVEVKRGDWLDFVTDCRGSVEYDSFTWAPITKLIAEGAAAPLDERAEWNAKTDFGGPPKEKPKGLDPWEKYAQVLLLANELVFVD